MSQEITITIDGKDGVVRPEIALKLLDLILRTLQSIDENTWAVGTRRLEWRIAKASVKNPLALTYSASPVRSEDVFTPDVVQLFISGCETIETAATMPPYFDPDDLKRMSEVGQLARHTKLLKLANTNSKHVVQPALLRDNAKDLFDSPDLLHAHGSVEGILVALRNFPDKSGAKATLLSRASQLVACTLTPAQAEDLNDCLDRKTRVILYGRIIYANNGPRSMVVESHKIIPPDDNLPTLENIRAMGLVAPEGNTIEDFVSEMRGDE